MIRSLHISNYALISQIDIEFAPGFNIITGETGAGKSIMLGAMSLLLGGRADMKVVRDSNIKSVIEAVFDISKAPSVKEEIKNAELDDAESDDCILRRELLPGGRSRAFVNDTPVTLSRLRDIALRLVDIHSQHQNLLLADTSYQLSILDNLAGNAPLLDKYAEAYENYRVALKKYIDTRELIRRRSDDAEYLSYQYDQLEKLNLVVGEQAQLERERELLGNLTEIKKKLNMATEPLSGDADNVLAKLSIAVEAIDALAFTLGEVDEDSTDGVNFGELSVRLESAKIEIRDIAETLTQYDSSLQADPERLEEVEQRLSALYSLEMKHHVETADELIKLRDTFASQLDALQNSDEMLSKLELSAKRAKKRAMELAAELSAARSACATEFAEELRRRAMPLGMQNLRCEIELSRVKLNPAGFDSVEFLFAFNKNQQPLPVGSTASGGEISRLMLAVKSIVAERMQLPSIVFDEVDTGVSGDVANRMASMMEQIGRRIQVITITHLPGVAAKGDVHFKVYKEDDETSTQTHIRRLTDDEREGEIALMLSGNSDDQAARTAARALMK